MITLEFRTLDINTCKLSDNRDAWTWELENRAFIGAQIFRIGDVDFSGEFPILGFAKSLNVIANHLRTDGSGAYWVDPELEKNSRTEFIRNGSTITVREVESCDRAAILCHAQIQLTELEVAAASYLEKAFAHCSRLFPAMLQSQDIQNWLKDRPHPPALPKKQ